MGRILPQGTQLYALAPTAADPAKYEVIKIDCAISTDMGEDTRDDHEDTCLEELNDHTFIPGLNTPGDASITVRIDPANPGHVRLEQFSDQPARLLWALGWSDGMQDAKGKTGGGFEFDLPPTRTWNVWTGHIKGFKFDGFEVGGDPIQGVITIKRSSKSRWIVKKAGGAA